MDREKLNMAPWFYFPKEIYHKLFTKLYIFKDEIYFLFLEMKFELNDGVFLI